MNTTTVITITVCSRRRRPPASTLCWLRRRDWYLSIVITWLRLPRLRTWMRERLCVHRSRLARWSNVTWLSERATCWSFPTTRRQRTIRRTWVIKWIMSTCWRSSCWIFSLRWSRFSFFGRWVERSEGDFPCCVTLGWRTWGDDGRLGLHLGEQQRNLISWLGDVITGRRSRQGRFRYPSCLNDSVKCTSPGL